MRTGSAVYSTLSRMSVLIVHLSGIYRRLWYNLGSASALLDPAQVAIGLQGAADAVPQAHLGSKAQLCTRA